jgi:hypothetical protein
MKRKGNELTVGRPSKASEQRNQTAEEEEVADLNPGNLLSVRVAG